MKAESTTQAPSSVLAASSEVSALGYEDLPPPDFRDDLILGSSVLLLFIVLLGMWMIPTSAAIAFALADSSSLLVSIGVA